jgi:hypothetical protein
MFENKDHMKLNGELRCVAQSGVIVLLNTSENTNKTQKSHKNLKQIF